MINSHIAALVLTGKPGSGAVTDAVALAALDALGGIAADARWLSQGDAWETLFAAPAPDGRAALLDAVARAIGSAPIDVNLVEGEGGARRKRLLCADMESTIITQELIDEMAGLVGCHAEVAAITAAAMGGALDFASSLARRVSLFRGLEVVRLDVLHDRVTLMPGAETLVGTMRANGARTALISGGFTLFAEPIARRLGFDHVVANVLEIENGRLTGRVHDPIVGPERKAAAVLELAAIHGLDAAQTLAVGDGANDVAMLAAAGLGVAFRAKPVLASRARAAENCAVVAHGDLSALLHLQGYRREALVG